MEPKPTASIEALLAEARWLEGLARALVGERESARDLVQEVWTRTLEHPPRDVRRPRAWLAEVLRNALHSRRRSEGARTSREQARGPSSTSATDDVVERAEAQRHLVEAVLALDEPLRKTVLLRFFDGLSSAEIARRQGVPDSTVRTRLAQALDLLRERLGRSRTDWQTGLGLIVCAEKELARDARWTPRASVVASFTALVLGGIWLWSSWSARAPSSPALARTLPPDPALTPSSTAASSLAAREAISAPSAAPQPAPLASELMRLRLVALVLAEGTEQPIPNAEVLLAGHVVATGDAHGRIDQELVVREDSPREVVRRIQRTLGERQSTRFVVRAEGWTERGIGLNDRLAGTVHLGVVLLRPASEVTGLVVDGDGVPVSGAGVTWYPGERSPEPQEAPFGWTTEPEWSAFTPGTVTDAAGHFRLRGVPFASGFLAAWGAPHAYGYGPAFRLPTSGSDEFTLVVPDLPGFHARIEGVVLDPSGAPLVSARVRVAGDGREELETDPEGRFSCVWNEPSSVALVASDPRGRYGPATLDCPDVEFARDLELRLSEPEWVTFEVRGSGRAIPEAKVTGHWSSTSTFGWEVGDGIQEQRTDGEGRVRFPRPPGELSWGVEAPGYRLAKGSVPAEQELTEPLVVELEPAKALRGRLMHAGAPVAGAFVHASDSAELSFRSRLVFEGENAFDGAYFAARRFVPARTDADGRFLVTHAGKWMLTLLVEAESFPPTTFGPLSAPHPEEREFELLTPGSLEGQVRLPLGARAFGRVVGVSNGFSFARTVPLEEDGTYRFASLAPGDYQVRCAPGPATEWVTIEPYGPERNGPIRFDCRVESGATTRFDLDLRGEGTCLWRARVDLPQPEERALMTRLHRIESDGGSIQVGQRELDAEGRVEFSLATPGPHRFEVAVYPSFSSRTQLTYTFEFAPGESSTFLELRPALLRFRPGERPAVTDGARANLVRFLGRGKAGWSTESVLALHQVNEELLLPVPSGTLTVETADGWKWSPELTWTTAGELTLAPGETVEPFATR